MNKQFATPDLPYPYKALEPYIDAETMRVHHDKHHAGYTTKLNAALEKHPEYYARAAEDIIAHIEDVPEEIRGAVRNNGGGHVNHSLFWEIMGPDAGGKPSGILHAAIERDFGSFEKFKKLFEEAAMTQFGSGWAWLVFAGGSLSVVKTSNQDTPLSAGKIPILALDIWEHAYYLKYRNLRPDYIRAFWGIINWDAVARKFSDASSSV